MILAILAAGHQALGSETDQFTTPRAPLYDIGPRLSRKVVEVIESGRKDLTPEQNISHWAGRNIFTSHPSRWVKTLRADAGQVTFRPNPLASIYRVALSPLPATFFFDSPTVHVHGYYMGTDKIDHFFQQGYEYFKVVGRYKARGAGDSEAAAAAVARGVRQERTYFGTLLSGVYSNGDLAANYAGMKFYLNLRHAVRIGDRVHPPLFAQTPEGWRLRPGIDADHLLEPFLSNHLDESLNPSRYRFSRSSIRSRVRARCRQWMQFYADRLDLVAPSGRSFASTWFGEEYGHWLPPSDEISIATECVEANPSYRLSQVKGNRGSRKSSIWRSPRRK